MSDNVWSSVVVSALVGQNGQAPASGGGAGGPQMVGLPEAAAQPAATTTGTPAPGATPTTGTPPAAPPNPFGGQFIWLMLGFLALMIFMNVFAGRKERKRRQELLSSMKRGDRVQLSSGIIGTITEIRDDDMVIKLEEGRARVLRSSVVTVLKESKSSDSPTVEIKAGKEKAAV